MSARFHRAAVIGAGAWGTTLARYLVGEGLDVCLWAHESEVVEAIRDRHENRLFLPGIPLPASLRATQVLADAVNERELILFAVPSHAARQVLRPLATALPETSDLAVVCVTKGIEEDSLCLMLEIMAELLPVDPRQLTVLSGPSFAREVADGQPTAVVLAGQDASLVHALQATLMSSRLRIYTSMDTVGVQLGGALKNVMALGAGIVDGLGLGHNARAALITRGLAEMVRLGQAMGAQSATFSGLAGMGDLVLTCTGALSRNYSVGVRLGRGESLKTVLEELHGVAEGVRTSQAAARLSLRHAIEMPIVTEVCSVLFRAKSPKQAVETLMERAAKDETFR